MSGRLWNKTWIRENWKLGTFPDNCHAVCRLRDPYIFVRHRRLFASLRGRGQNGLWNRGQLLWSAVADPCRSRAGIRLLYPNTRKHRQALRFWVSGLPRKLHPKSYLYSTRNLRNRRSVHNRQIPTWRGLLPCIDLLCFRWFRSQNHCPMLGLLLLHGRWTCIRSSNVWRRFPIEKWLFQA